MLRRPFVLPSVVSLLLCVATLLLWVRGSGGAGGDYFGWKRQQSDGRDVARDEWSVRSAAGRLQVAHRSTTPPARGAGTQPRVSIGAKEEGWFWSPAVEAPKADRSTIEIQRKTAAPTTAPAATQPAQQPAERAFNLINEDAGALRTRGVAMNHWLLALASAVLPARWLFLGLRAGSPDGDEPGRSDRVPALARVFASLASLSLLLAFVLGVGWVKSWYGGDRMSWRDPNRPRFVDLHSGNGRLVAHYRSVADEKLVRNAPELAMAPNGFKYRQDGEGNVGYTPKLFCFDHDAQAVKDGGRSLTLAAPYWALVIGALVLPTWWLRNQKFGPIKVTSFGRPAPRKDKPTHAKPLSQRPI